MKAPFIVAFLILSVQGTSQANLDSLEQTLTDKAIPDTMKLESYLSLARYYHRRDLDTSIMYTSEGLQLGIKMGYPRAVAMLYNQRGLAFRSRGDYDGALTCFLAAAELNLKQGESQELELASNYGNIGGIYQNKGDLSDNRAFSEKAIEYYDMARQIFVKHDDKMGIAGCHVEMGIIHYDFSEYPESIQEYEEALKICEELGFLPGKAMILNNMGNTYSEMGDSIKSLELNLQVMEIYEAAGDSMGLMTVYSNMAGIYNKMKLWTKSVEFGERSYRMATRMKSLEDIQSASGHLSRSYQNLGNHELAFEYLMTYVDYKDSLLNEESSRQIEEMEGKFQNDKKTLELKNMKQKHELDEVEDRRKEETYALQEKITWSVAAGGLASFVLLILAVRGYVQKRKANHLIAKQKVEVEIQKEIVEAKNEEILDSINYAKRIQTAILPPARLLKEYLPDSFVLYMFSFTTLLGEGFSIPPYRAGC